MHLHARAIHPWHAIINDNQRHPFMCLAELLLLYLDGLGSTPTAQSLPRSLVSGEEAGH